MCRLIIDGEDYCEILEIIADKPFQGRGQWEIHLDKPVTVGLLETRVFQMRLADGTLLPLTVYADQDDGDGLVIMGCPG